MNTISKEEESYYIAMIKAAIDIASEGCANAYEKTPEIVVAAIFEKIASPLYFLRQGDFSHETPTLNMQKMPSNEDKNKDDATIGYERKARLLKEGWEEMPKYPDIVYKTVGNLTFFEDTRDGRTWIRRHRGGEE